MGKIFQIARLCFKLTNADEHCLLLQVKTLTSLLLTALSPGEPEALTNKLTLCLFVLVVPIFIFMEGRQKTKCYQPKKLY